MFNFKTQKFFIYCALIFGIIMIAVIPPFQSPDEDSHFKKAYVVSYGKLYPSSQNGVVGYNLPNDMVKYINEKLSTYTGNRNKKYSYDEQIIDDRLPKDYSDVSFYNFSTAETMPFAYLGPALGVWVARISSAIVGLKNISITHMLYFARFFSLLLYIIIVAFAIKITPILKKTFCAIALIPMSLSLAAAISYDSVLMATSLLATAIIFKLIFDDNVKKINYKYIVGLGVIGFILLSVKTVYATVLLPIIFVPKEKFDGGSKKSIIKTFEIIIGISVGLFLLNKLPALFIKKAAGDGAITAQIQFILNHPIYYIKVWLTSMISNRNFYLSGMFGTFGLLDTYVLTMFMVVYFIAFFAVVLSDLSTCKNKFNWKYKIVSVLGNVISIFGIFIALYILWTSSEIGIGAPTITGVQGRYFLPLLPLAIVLLSNKWMVKNEKMKTIFVRVLQNSYLVSFLGLLVSCLTIFLRFWC